MAKPHCCSGTVLLIYVLLVLLAQCTHSIVSPSSRSSSTSRAYISRSSSPRVAGAWRCGSDCVRSRESDRSGWGGRASTSLGSLSLTVESCLRNDNGTTMPYLVPPTLNTLNSGGIGDSGVSGGSGGTDLSLLLGIRLQISPGVSLRSDLLDLRGAAQYAQIADSWEPGLAGLPQGRCELLSVRALGEEVVQAQWRVCFVPDPVLPLFYLGSAVPFWRITFYDLLDREKQRSAFNWLAFARFWGNLLRTGEMRLPHAVVLGTSEMRFRREVGEVGEEGQEGRVGETGKTGQAMEVGVAGQVWAEAGKETAVAVPETSTDTFAAPARAQPGSGGGLGGLAGAGAGAGAGPPLVTTYSLVSQRDSLKLVSSINSGVLQNRKLATDVLQYLDASKPPFLSQDDWNDLIIRYVKYSSVPGMKLFDIEGLEPEGAAPASTGSGGGSGISWRRAVARGARVSLAVGLLAVGLYYFEMTLFAPPTFDASQYMIDQH
ncbi:hypothetical protein B484DRAFT_452455 [Ochromonadaceae sp. CCMP2298]|nr:hypothetical protein B484DRAFT_452455 [Ochromonadaceae sp. CCMP2298]